MDDPEFNGYICPRTLRQAFGHNANVHLSDQEPPAPTKLGAILWAAVAFGGLALALIVGH